MGDYTILQMFENPRRGRQARNFTTNVPKILDLKSSSEKIFSENCRWVPLLQLRSSSGRSHTSVNVYNFGNLFSISLSIKKSNMYNLITASHFFSAGSSPACIQVVGITVSKQVHSRSQCYDLIRLSVDKNSFTCLLSHFQFQLCLRTRFLLLFGLSFKSLDVMILLHLNNNGKNRYISRKRANDCFSVYVF